MNNYFIDTDIWIEGNYYLRDIQRESHRRLKHAFIDNEEQHKIIVLPTGAGKTGVIALAPYKIAKGRVLVITPSLIIREGISDDFDTRTMYNFWSQRKAIIDDEKLPQVYRYAGYNSTHDKKRVLKYLNSANIVIANIHKVYSTQSKKTLTEILDSDFFDMIIIDEAHHAEAESWKETMDFFDAKKILKLTATPIRSDEKVLDGKIIYEYELGQAIEDGIIKNIVAEDYTSDKLEFVVNGKKCSKDEALQEMDKKWVTRSVAYSEECSRTIVEMSIERLNEKRKFGEAFHQIIAVACSIEHAEQLKDLYNEYNVKAEYVSSDRQDHSKQAIIDFKKGILDVIINVNMLGEGFDHPNISIAAIFRPFRTLAPYAQFIGRALRRIDDQSINEDIDNVAHVIYHKELELDLLWEYYTKEKQLADRRRLIRREVSGEIKKRDAGEVITDGDVIVNTKTYLRDGIAGKYSESIKIEIDRFESELENQINGMKELNMSEDAIKDFEKVRRKSLDEKITKKRNEKRQELIREELHELHIDDIINQMTNLFERTELDPEDNLLPSHTSNVFLKNSKDNKAYVRKYINSTLKTRLKRGIDEWETYDFEKARKMLLELIVKLEEKIMILRGESDGL